MLSELNIEILPAGESYEVLHALRAEAIPAVLDTVFTCPEAWESFTIKQALSRKA